MYSNKENVNILTSLLVAHGVRHAVVCPGSRNAAIVHNLNECEDITCYSVYDELVRRYNEKTLSFRNVVVFNAYEYYPLQKDSSLRTINQLKDRFLNHVDVAEQNIFTLDGFVAQDAVQDSCRLYEQRIKT